MGRVEREMLLPLPPAEAWEAVTDLSAWFGAEVDADLRPGGRAEFRWPDGTVGGALVEDVDPPHRLAFRWAPFLRLPDGRVRRRPTTEVEILLEPHAHGTRLRVVEAPLARVGFARRQHPAPTEVLGA